jgi:hypothetical protein
MMKPLDTWKHHFYANHHVKSMIKFQIVRKSMHLQYNYDTTSSLSQKVTN